MSILAQDVLFRKSQIPSELADCFEPAECGQCYVCRLVAVFAEVWRVMKPSATLFLNLGDVYTSGGRKDRDPALISRTSGVTNRSAGLLRAPTPDGLKPKDLCGIPWRVAFALQAAGWWLRSDIIWSKPNPMPESVTDRPTKSHEYLFLLARAEHYYYDQEAVREGDTTYTRRANTNGNSIMRVERGEETRVRNIGGLGDRDTTTTGRNKRTVWHIATQPYAEAHFACVDADTDCLTIDGWKRYDELIIGETIAAYDLTTRECCWTRLNDVAVYPVRDQEMVAIQGRQIDQLLTPNHRCVVRRRTGIEKVRRADTLKSTDAVIVASPWKDGGKPFPERLTRLIGWYVTEGCAGRDCVTLYQSGNANPAYCDEIRGLLVDEGAEFVEASRTRDWRGRDSIAISWRVTGAVAHELLALCPGKRLPAGFLEWDRPTLLCLWDTLMKGDGHFRQGGRNTFVQKDFVLVNQVQALCTRLGYTTTLQRRSLGTYSLYTTESSIRWLHTETDSIISRQLYTGVVWCPSTNYETFVARRNGRTFITGNTYPEALVTPCVLAGSSEAGVCSKCGKPWARVTETNPEYERLAATNRGWSATGDELIARQRKGHPSSLPWKSRTTGWRASCTCGAPTRPAVVLDPFVGAGTTLVVAAKQGRDGIGIDLNPDYLEMARKRIEPYRIQDRLF